MKLYLVLQDIEIQCEYKVVIFDYDKEERIEVNEEDYNDGDIDYLYVDDGILYIELDKYY